MLAPLAAISNCHEPVHAHSLTHWQMLPVAAEILLAATLHHLIAQVILVWIIFIAYI